MTDSAVLQSLVGKWKMIKGENIDDFMKELGKNYLIRKLAASSTPVQIISVDGDSIKLVIATPVYNQTSIMKLNEKFTEKQKGMEMECISYIKDGAFVFEQNPVEGSNVKHIKTTRDLRGGKLFEIVYIGDVICTKVFERVD